MLYKIKSVFSKHYSWVFSGVGVVVAVAILTLFFSDKKEGVSSLDGISVEGDQHIVIQGNSNTVESIKISSDERKNAKQIFERYSFSFQTTIDRFCREGQAEEVMRELLFIDPSKMQEAQLALNEQKKALGHERGLFDNQFLIKYFVDKKNFRPTALQNEDALYRIVKYSDLYFSPKYSEELRLTLDRILLFHDKLAAYAVPSNQKRAENEVIDHIHQYCSDLKRAKEILDGF